MPECVLLYATAPDEMVANTIAAALLDARAAACVNIIPGMRSFYRWQGRVECADEIVMVVKTTKVVAEKARRIILERHPHATPAILALPVDADRSSATFLDWIAAETA